MNRALLRYRLRKLRALPVRQLLWLARAQLALVWAIVLVRTRPPGRLVQHTSSSGAAESPVGAASDEARMLALAVERAAEHGLFRPTCLVRSVALQRLLQRRRISGSRIQIGVRLENGKFMAHAWVEWRGEVLGDRTAHTSTFAPLCDVDLAGLR